MVGLTFLFLFLTAVSGLFSFGVIEDIRWWPAQIAFAVFLILFIISAIASFRPSQQVRFPGGAPPKP
jgi:uncharacterized membrane protein YtjA (UPF0391 family)